MAINQIDINADVGEGLGNESEIMPYLSSCNISCGAHAGNEKIMDYTIALAIKNNVKIGAHPSFPDKKNFGRKPMKLTKDELMTSLSEQLTLFEKILKANDANLHHIKPHGALYNLAAVDRKVAQVVVALTKNQGKSIKLYVPYGSIVAELAQKQGVEIVYEAFADRNYNSNLTLVSRQNEQAIITNPNEVFNHCLSILKKGKVKCLDGNEVSLKASTLCIHGDNENILGILRFLKIKLRSKGIEIS